MFPARIELATFRVWGGRDNHYTTETTVYKKGRVRGIIGILSLGHTRIFILLVWCDTYLTLGLATRKSCPCGTDFRSGAGLVSLATALKACAGLWCYRCLWCCGFPLWSLWLVVHLQVQASTVFLSLCSCCLWRVARPFLGPARQGLTSAVFFFFFRQYAAGLYGENCYFIG